MKTYEETLQLTAEIRAQMLAFPSAPMGTYIPEEAISLIYSRDIDEVTLAVNSATLARFRELKGLTTIV